MSPEAAARLKIDALLIAAGWAIQDYKAFNPSAARGIALREVPLASGRCDYLLLVDRIPLGVIEAKKEGTTLSTVSDQSAHYGENLPAFLADLLEDSANLPAPDVIAQEIVDDLEAALEQFSAITDDLKKP